MKRFINLLVCLMLIDGQTASAIKLRFWKKPKPSQDACVSLLEPEPPPPSLTNQEAMAIVTGEAPLLVEKLGRQSDPPYWYKILEDYILPYRQSRSNQLAIAFIGPGNSGKSTVLNAIASRFQTVAAVTGEPTVYSGVSQSDFSEGNTTRPLLIVNTAVGESQALNQRFGPLEQWQSATMPNQPGPAIVYPIANFFKRLILIDSPATDITAHKEASEKVERWADVLAYVFTYTNYRNELNLQNLHRTFQQLGKKPVIMIYRAPASIPRSYVEDHMREVAEAMFPGGAINQDTGLPKLVIGSYVLVESDQVASRQATPVILPFRQSKRLPDLLKELDSQAGRFRRLSLNVGFQTVLNGIIDDIQGLEREQSEIKITDVAFQLLLKNSIDEELNTFPYDRLSADLREIWTSRMQGIHQAARWNAHPIRSTKGYRTALAIDDAERGAIEKFLNSSINKIITDTHLAASRGLIVLPENEPGVSSLIKTIADLRMRYRVPYADEPFVVKKGTKYEIHLPKNKKVVAKLDSFMNRDWDQSRKEIRAAALDSILRLTYLIQGELTSVIGRTRLGHRAVKTFHSVAALAPIMALGFYTMFSGTVDIKSVVAFAYSILHARFFVHLDDRTLDKEWHDIIFKWFHERQTPFFVDLLNKYAKFDMDPSPVTVSTELGRLRAAARYLRGDNLYQDNQYQIGHSGQDKPFLF